MRNRNVLRLFVGFRLAKGLVEMISARMDGLRESVPGARWVPAENLHLTLFFIGDMESSRVAVLSRSLTELFASAPPVLLRLAAPGLFPLRGRGRIAWVGVEPLDELRVMHRDVSRLIGSPLVKEENGRVYHPHLTVARARKSWPQATREILEEGLAGCRGEWRADRGTLFRSELGPKGVRYTAVSELPMGI